MYRGGGEEGRWDKKLGGVDESETVVQMYCVREESILTTKKLRIVLKVNYEEMFYKVTKNNFYIIHFCRWSLLT